MPGCDPPTRNDSIGKALVLGGSLGVAVCVAVFLVHSFVGNNLHTVVPGQVYRSSQMSGDALEKVVRRLGVRTVINLRGPCLDQRWWQDECRVTSRLGVAQEDVCFSASHLPPVGEVRHFVEVLDHCEYPVLFHCFRGVDRTGLATALVLMLKTDTPLDEARRSLGLRYLHLSFGSTGYLDRFLDQYQGWLEARGERHSPERLRTWVNTEYRGGACAARLELLALAMPDADEVPVHDGSAGPNGRTRLSVPRDVPIGLRVRCHNTSNATWHFHPNDNAGVHAYWRMLTPEGIPILAGRAGRIHTDVPPGTSIDLTLPLPPFKTPGIVRVQMSMIEEQQCDFTGVGMEALNVELEVP